MTSIASIAATLGSVAAAVPANGTGNAATTTTAAAAATSAGTGISADYNMFLKLLTTQLQNQDPLSPMDTSQYTQQLVQYSQVEQTLQGNATLKDILASLSTQNLSQMSGFLGREAQFDSPVAGLSATAPAQWSYAADRGAASMVATITDAHGKVVDTRPIAADAATGRFSWDGTLASGSKAAAGAYTLAITALGADGGAVPVTIHGIGTVSGIGSASGATTLTANGVDFPASQLSQVGAAAD